MSSTRTSKKGAIVSFVLSSLFVIVAAWLFLNRQFALDQYAVWTYEPAASVQNISDKVKFTDKGKFVFYATKPVLADKQTFNERCPRHEVGSPILGCYTGSDEIYIYDLTNEKLNGMEEVTAVHEMLHAAWYRFSPEERDRLGELLKTAYDNIDDKDLRDRMSYYSRTEPGQTTNELHSILGTEVHNLGPELENHYEKYFDREVVLGYHDQYNDVYRGLHDRADELYIAMETLGQSIQRRSAAYESASAALSSDIASFNSRANRGDFSSTNQFYSERAVLVNRTDQLNAERSEINKAISTYNGYYKEYQNIAAQIEGLNESMDSFHEIKEAPRV